MEAADRRGAYGQIKHTELEYEKAHPGEIGRHRAGHRAEGTALRNFAIEVGARMRAKQGAGPEAPPEDRNYVLGFAAVVTFQ